MGENISQNNAYVWKAKAISRGKLLERFRDLIQNMADNVTNEGDRVYFGSTNDYDELREIGEEMDMWKWDAIMRERPEPDPYADCRRLRAALAAKDAEIKRLRDALTEIHGFALTCEHDDGFDREIGPIGCNLGDLCVCVGYATVARDALAGGKDHA